MMTGILLMSVAPCLIADCLLYFFFQVGESCSYSADSLKFLSVPRQCLLKKRVVMCSVIVSISLVAMPWLRQLVVGLTTEAQVRYQTVLCGNFQCLCMLFFGGK